MTTQELLQLQDLRQEVASLEERLAELREHPPQITTKGDGMPKAKGKISDPVGGYTATVVALEALLESQKEKCIQAEYRATQFILSIPDSLTRQIFTMRYMQGMTWGQTARNLSGRHSADAVRMAAKRFLRSTQI